ncbi:SNP47 protein, partial [Pomatostomus ruficeps]|nr:SNP47 protein [Pomatostomus ruficeps]
MAEEPRIHSWPCCYYLDSSRQWIPGKLSLTPVSLRFTADGSGELLVDSRLSGIAAIRKESSLLLFRALTVLERGAKHWFGSVRPSRNAAFTVLEHFWRQQLLPAGSGAGAGAGKGRELVGMLAGSQRSLEATAQALHSQGEQFDGILRGLHKIEGDMDVADRLLTELESPSWWPFSGKLWKTAPEAKPKEASPKETPAPEEGQEILLRIPVILTGGGDRGAAKAAALTVLPSGLEIRDGNSQLLHRFASRDVDDIRVHTPYELSVRQRFIGKPDHSCRLLAARMPEAIPVLAARFPGKLQFLEDALGFAGAAKSPQGDLGASLWQA